ncbi:MAG: hypothetical protein Q9218_000223 [Villophora microphyllina]
MDSSSTGKVPRLGLSLYANLLDGQNSGSVATGTISRAPIVFGQGSGGTEGQDDDTSAQRQQPSAASFRFQPTKRPQASFQKSKMKSKTQKLGATPSAEISQSLFAGEPGPASGTFQPLVKTTLSDWAAEPEEDDVNGFYANEKRQRGGRKKRKKNKEFHVAQNWDDIYDPSRPNSYEEYQNSDEKVSDIREWKGRLYAHRFVGKGGGSSYSSSDDGHRVMSRHTVVPSGFLFAPPANLKTDHPLGGTVDDATTEDVYPLRLDHMTQPQNSGSTHDDNKKELVSMRSHALLQSGLQVPSKSIGHESHLATPSISRAPVRYNLPPPPSEIPESEADLAKALASDEVEAETTDYDQGPRSLRPGQQGFAQRLMSKYGWTKGSGLGASGTGIVNPLRVQVEKQKKKPDSEGGGYAVPGGRGKIFGGKKAGESNASSKSGKFGVMSEVVVLHGMVDGLDLDAEMERADDGGLLQEIGDECGEKAVNALEGRIFNGNAITAIFYDRESFDTGIYGGE